MILCYRGAKPPEHSEIVNKVYTVTPLNLIGDQATVFERLRSAVQNLGGREVSIAVADFKSRTEEYCDLAKLVLAGSGRPGDGWMAGTLADFEASEKEIHDILHAQGAYTQYKNHQVNNLGDELQEKVNQAVIRFQPIVITGPSGTGKTRLARQLHRMKFGVEERPLLEISLANLSLHMFEDSLCGHIEGAFTGANRESDGAFRASDGGTLFLDEFAETSLEVQTKLLRYLNDANDSGYIKYTKLGETETRSSEAWVVCATNKNIQESISRRELRSDIMHRFALTLNLPSFTEKCQAFTNKDQLDSYLTHLIREHLAELCARTGWLYPAWLPDSLIRIGKKVLLSYHWPGNDRQLRALFYSLVYRHVLRDTDRNLTSIDVGDLRACMKDELAKWGPVPSSARTDQSDSARAGAVSVSSDGDSPSARLERLRLLEHELMEETLINAGNPTAAARNLQLNRQAFLDRLHRFRTSSSSSVEVGGKSE